MRILHIDCMQEMRGGQWQVLRLLRGLRQRGVESILLTPTNSPLGKKAAQEGFPVDRVRWRFPAADLIHAHDAHAHTLAAFRARQPLIVARRVAFPIKQGLLSKWKYRRPARFIAVSHHVAAILTEAGVPQSKISVVHDGVPLLPLSTRTGNVIEMVKNTSNLERELLSASILVYVTDTEGLGSGALMAMSAGVPVIASRVGGIPEVIEDGVNGILIGADPGEARPHVKRLLDNPAEAARLAANARRTIEERFTVDRMVEDTLAVYRMMLNARGKLNAGG